MNELIFIFHVFAIVASCILALRLGKEALITLIVIQAILANLFITKEISLFHLCVTCTDAFAVGSGLALNLLQEYYGKVTTKKAIFISFCALIFYLVMSQFQLWYQPILPQSDQAYSAILSLMPRLIGASLISYLICQLIDYKVYAFLKTKLHRKFFIVRNYGSLLISQAVDTVLFSFLGLYGVVHHIWHIIFVSYLIKIITIFIATPFIQLLKNKFNTQS
jgi:queuosine precursor transporter